MCINISLLVPKVKKAYGNNLDNMQIQEELARMREFALKQLDRNGDTMISLQEFMSYTEEEKFEENDEWKAVADEEEVCTSVCLYLTVVSLSVAGQL